MTDRRQPGLEHLDAMAPGWAGLAALTERMSTPALVKRDQPRDDLLAAVNQFERSSFGQTVLEWMLDRTVRVASVPHVGAERLLQSPAELASLVIWNEARKALVLEFLTLINEAKSEKP